MTRADVEVLRRLARIIGPQEERMAVLNAAIAETRRAKA